MPLPPEAAAGAGYAFGIWTGWGLVHSVLATRRVKAACELVFGPERFALYPFGYTVVSLWTFWLAWTKGPSLPQVLWDVPFGPALVLYGLEAVGAGLICWAGVSMGLLRFLGFEQFFDFVRGRPAAPPDPAADFVTTGAYALVRHPMHLGGFLILFCAPRQTLGTCVFSVFACLYMLFGTFIEERRLSAALGDRWAEYAARVPLLLPRPRFRGYR